MKIKLLILCLFIGKLLFAQLPTYKAKYSCIKSMSYLLSSDSNSINTDGASMVAEIEVIANDNYALITNRILKINNALLQEEIKQMMLKDSIEVCLVVYSTKTVYFINDNKAFTYLADIFDTSANIKKLGKYTCNLNYEKTGNTLREGYNIWTSKTIPGYISPGLFYSRDIGGIVKLDNTETVIELKEINESEFDFKPLLKRIESIKKINVTEGRLGSL